MAFVLDSSVTMAWCFPDEATPFTESVFDRLWETEALVPAIWPLEVANVLLVGERGGRLATVDTARFLRVLQGLPITVDTETSSRAFGPILLSARQNSLSAYDGAYLELAMRQALPLATMDQQLRAAAARAGVPLLQ